MSDTAAADAPKPGADLPPKTLECADCQQEWQWDGEEQAYFTEKGYDEPKRCKACREVKKQNHRGNRPQRRGPPGACFNCGDPSHYARDCPSGQQGGYQGGGGYGGNRAASGNCFNCQQPGHIARNCPQSGGGGGGRMPPRPRGACYDFQKGQCTRGDSCKFTHEQ